MFSSAVGTQRLFFIFAANAAMSGCFIAEKPTGLGKEFLKLDYDWLHTSLIVREPSATDKMVDLEAALDFSKNYYLGRGDSIAVQNAVNSHEMIKELQRKMKRNMPFVYRPS